MLREDYSYSGPPFRAAGASVLQHTVCVPDRTYWQCFKKTSFCKQVKIKCFIRRDWQLMVLKHVFSGY